MLGGGGGGRGVATPPLESNFFFVFLFNFNSTVHPTPQPPFTTPPSVPPPHIGQARSAPVQDPKWPTPEYIFYFFIKVVSEKFCQLGISWLRLLLSATFSLSTFLCLILRLFGYSHLPPSIMVVLLSPRHRHLRLLWLHEYELSTSLHGRGHYVYGQRHVRIRRSTNVPLGRKCDDSATYGEAGD